MPFCGDLICGAASPEELGDPLLRPRRQSVNGCDFTVQWDATGVARVDVT
jgi:hypothetical protein